MEQSGRCYCPVCLRDLDGRLLIDEHVWLVRHCPDHGLVRTMLLDDPMFLTAATELARHVAVARRTCLVAEVTDRCDQLCKTCSASSTMSGDEQDASELIRSVLSRAEAVGADVVALSGGEPLMRRDLWEIVDALHATIPKIVIITSGRDFERNPSILLEIGARAGWLEIYLQFDSLRDDVLRALRSPDMTADLRRRRLGLAVATGAATTAVCVIAPDSDEREVAELATFCRDAGAAGVTFQPLRQLGRHPSSGMAGPMSTIDHIQTAALSALGGESVARPFMQQPFDMTVAFIGEGASPVERFFRIGHKPGSFRVATSSYWDFTNFFEPLATGRHYFHVEAGQALNARCFDAALRDRSAALKSSMRDRAVHMVDGPPPPSLTAGQDASGRVSGSRAA